MYHNFKVDDAFKLKSIFINLMPPLPLQRIKQTIKSKSNLARFYRVQITIFSAGITYL